MKGANNNIGNRSKGFSLIEIILVLTLSMLVLVGVFFTYKKVSGHFKTQATAEQILTINRNVKNIFKHSDYSDLDSFVKTAEENKNAASQIFPEKMVNTLSSGRFNFLNGFSRPVQLSEDAYSDEFYIYTSVPVEYCTNISSLVYNQSAKISINGIDFENYSIERPNKKNDLKINELSSACHSASNPYVYITFSFY